MSLVPPKKERYSFSQQPLTVAPPHLLSLQLNSYHKLFIVEGSHSQRKKTILYKILKENLDITEPKGNYTLHFLDYHVAPPYYTPEQCIDLGITYDVPLKVKLRLVCKDGHTHTETQEEAFLGNIPYMTPRGFFVFKGIKRAIISQIKRSYGIFFSQNKHPSGTILYSAKIVPLRGIWLEFAFDIHGTLYAYIDRRKKVPITLLLRAIGYGSDKEILQLFGLAQEIELTKENLEKNIGKKIAARLLKTWVEEMVDEETAEVLSVTRTEVLFDRNTPIQEENIAQILASKESKILLYQDQEEENPFHFIYQSLLKDDTNSEKEAIDHIYFQLRGFEPSDEQEGREFVQQLFFHPKRCFLSNIGRYCLNKKLGLNISEEIETLTKKDIIAIIQAFADLLTGKRVVEDTDSLTNRIVQASGDLLHQVIARGIKLTGRHVREEMSSRDSEELKPTSIISGHYFVAALHSFLSTGSQSQLLDEVNILSVLSHLRRKTKIGTTISRERANFEARDVHETYYNRICHIKTPEGLNTGLVLEAALYAKIDERGAVKTPYKKVIDGKVDPSDKMYYLAADEEEKVAIAQLTNHIAKDGTLTEKKIKARVNQSEWVYLTPQQIDYIDLSYNQSLSASAALIPFLEYNESTRVVVGSNMQGQALPLLQPEPPIVGTGQEKTVVKDAHILPTADRDGTIIYVDAEKIILQPHLNQEEKKVALTNHPITYDLPKFKPTNQNTSLHLKPIVKKNDTVKKDTYLAEGYGIKDGELALGANLRVAYISANGKTYEDGIVISDRLVKEDLLTSIHIKTFTLELYETTQGPEEFTADIPNVSEEDIKNLDENGIIRIGASVQEGDILIGKITPQSEATNLSPENKLLQAIFGAKAASVRDSSLRVPNSFRGTVIATEILSRRTQKEGQLKKIKEELKTLHKENLETLLHLRQKAIKTLRELLKNHTITKIQDKSDKKTTSSPQTLTKETLAKTIFPTFSKSKKIDFVSNEHLPHFGYTQDKTINKQIQLLADNYIQDSNQIVTQYKQQKRKLEIGDEIPSNTLKIARVFVAKKQKIQVGDKLSNKYGNKGVVVEVSPEEDMPYFQDGTRVDIILNPLGLPSRMNIGQLKESALGWAGHTLQQRYTVPAFEGPNMEQINQEMEKANLPAFGLCQLYDGLTGEPFENKVTCGISHILKLNHLVDDKIHARDIGPYGYINGQPLGGRSNKGGQRIGEMEIWALEAYGAAHMIHEMMNIKSDDIEGRKEAYEAIVKGHNVPLLTREAEAFKFLLSQLRGLGIDITLK